MTSYVTPKKNAAYIFYVALVSQANRPAFQTNPTLAAGDVKVITDGVAKGNADTLPDVEPDADVSVRVQLSADEMNGDNVCVIFQDAAGAQWDDLFIGIQTTARQVDDLAYSAETMDSTVTLKQAMNIMLAALAGKSTGGGGETITFRDAADSKARITATVDSAGNRTAITTDGA